MNVGTVTDIKIDDQNCFFYFIMTMRANIRGFQSHLTYLAIDGIVLKGRYRKTLYIALAIDGNEQTYLLAFGIGDGENEATYT